MMRLPREDRFSEIEPLLPLVEKPARYLDHEWGAVREQDGPFHACMVYPDTYEVGQPSLGVSILYNQLNEAEGISCERAFLPWVDMCDLMRERGVPMLSLETASPIASFDMVGFSLAHELAGTNVLEALDLAGIALRAADRDEDDPIILAGGPAAYNIEPIAEVFDAVLLGDGEESIVEVACAIRDGRERGLTRSELVASLAQVPGTYVPSLYDIVIDDAGTCWGYAVPKEGSGAPEVVLKRAISSLSDFDALAARIVPYMQTVHDRISIEVLRGCARGCRFCQAGMIYRPVRERTADEIVSACTRGLRSSGYDEISLTSLSTTDHSRCSEMLHRINAVLDGTGTRVSIPSQRLDSFGVEMAAEVAGAKKGGLTFAPEAGSQRLRDVINKNIVAEDLERAARNAFENGWRRMKLYFMMGLPTETDDDIRAIPELAERVLEIGREVVPKGQRGGLSVSISVGTFVPKPHTPFQWGGQLDVEEVRRRQQLLLESTHDRAIRIAYSEAKLSLLEAALSRAGRGALELVIGAWERGARFDAWSDQFDFDAWLGAAEAAGLDIEEMATLDMPLDARLPWEHTSCGVTSGYLKREWRRALDGVTTEDCTFESCTGCGVCPALGVDNVLVGERS